MQTLTKIYKLLIIFTFSSTLFACTSYDYPGDIQLGETIMSFQGESLEGDVVSFPVDLAGKSNVLLFGYVQDSQFDIDRWLIGLDMLEVSSPVYEIPTIKGMLPRMFSSVIDNGMRKGIPKELWKGVVTVYDDGDKVQAYTGNKDPNNARVVVIDEAGIVVYFYNRGFSVSALKDVKSKLSE